jgi:ribosomal protein S28E/S33
MEQELRQVKWELAHVRNEIRNLTKEVEVEVFVGDMVTA